MTSDTVLVRNLEKRVDGLQKEVSALKDTLNVHENWNSEVRRMIGKQVKIESTTCVVYQGELLWTDRYCLCIHDNDRKRRLTLNKGGIVSVSLAE